MSLDNVRIVQTLVDEGFNKGNYKVVDELIHPDMVENEKHDASHPNGPEGVKMVMSMVRSAFSDWHLTIDEYAVDGDKVWARMTGRGTNDGSFFGYPASNKKAEVLALEMMRIVDGQVVEHWAVVDMYGTLVQLGLIPPPGPMPPLEQ